MNNTFALKLQPATADPATFWNIIGTQKLTIFWSGVGKLFAKQFSGSNRADNMSDYMLFVRDPS
jgi:hypothetical protein